MSAHIIDGKAIALSLREEVRVEIAALNITPGLAVVLVGEDPASRVYVASKEKACLDAGIASFPHKIAADTSQTALLSLINTLNHDAAVNGILVQLPLPSHIDEKVILQAIDPKKDVDGFHPVNQGLLMSGAKGLVPCTPLGCIIMLKQVLGLLAGKHAVVIGRSNIVGKPVALLLLNESATVTIAHSKTQNLESLVKQADIVVAAVGRPLMVKGSWLKPGCVVIDVGINRVEGKLVGDVDFHEAVEIASHITPVPGGVGPMTIACLMKNTLEAFKLQN
jgi:methylenetetrahydrofolate dehydrogenase (NADP+) / methenyltetrahydrofolate cyclohydrolase